MNKDVCVLTVDYDTSERVVSRIVSVESAAHAPCGVFGESGSVSKRDVNYWWRHRAIPASREQIRRILDDLRLDSTLELAERSFGLSLSVRSWLDDVCAPQRWEDISFFDNDFNDDLGALTLGRDSDPGDGGRESLNLTSPNSTLGGDLRKAWKILGGRCVLVKAGVVFANQEPYNEAIATELHRRLMEPGTYTAYHLINEGRRTYCACENEELVPACDLIRKRKQRSGESDLMFYVRCCEEQGLTNAMEGLSQTFGCDYVLANRDRHWRNFGIMRDVTTLEGRAAPWRRRGAAPSATISNRKEAMPAVRAWPPG